jgi:hypothetical protein
MERHEREQQGIQTTDLEILAKAFFHQRVFRRAQTRDRFSGLFSSEPEEVAEAKRPQDGLEPPAAQ